MRDFLTEAVLLRRLRIMALIESGPYEAETTKLPKLRKALLRRDFVGMQLLRSSMATVFKCLVAVFLDQCCGNPGALHWGPHLRPISPRDLSVVVVGFVASGQTVRFRIGWTRVA